jgi:ATP-binding cassette subfamily B protein
MLLYLVGGILIAKGDAAVTIGTIIASVTLLGRLYGPVSSLFNLQVDITRSMALFQRIFDYFDRKREVENKPGALRPERIRGDIEFRDVGFSYVAGHPILRGIRFHLAPGEMVALVGPSGAGKSTVTNLIPRLYDVTDGAVLVDGTDVRDLDLDILRASIGVVTQDTYLFNGTVKENLLYAKASATQEELESACRAAHIHDFIATLPDGYDSLVGNRGIKLSGGEKQRVSIARVILKDPSIMLLDEATSSLDSISESAIQAAIEPLLKGRTSLVIAHRLSTVMAADRILVLSGGEIVETGRHEDLVERSTVYKELYETQFKKALEDHDRREANRR